MKKILFVCTGNICRSPSAEAVLRHLLNQHGKAEGYTIDSAGTHGYHIGEAPDPRSAAIAKKRGISMEGLKARKVTLNDFTDFDLILGMDTGHVDALHRLCPADSKAKIVLFLEYAGIGKDQDVPDPYYGNSKDFEHTLNLIESGALAMLNKLHP